jgi:hypothetical protein
MASRESIKIGLAARVGIDRNSASGRGIVERRVSETDRRARLLRLTANGERLFRQVRKGNLAAQARALALLTRDERELLHDLLTRLVAANGAHALRIRRLTMAHWDCVDSQATSMPIRRQLLEESQERRSCNLLLPHYRLV